MKRIKLFFSILLVAFTLFLVSCEAGAGPFAVTSIQKVGQNEEGYIYEITFIDNNSYQFIVPFGVDGEPGKDGSTPYIGENGNWWLGDTDLGLSAQGPKGDQGESGNDGIDGDTPYIGENGNWWLVDKDLGIPAQGPKGDQGESGNDGIDGKDGDTPYIGENGNWWLGDKDLAILAQGPKGDQGESGNDGIDGKDGDTPYIGENGNWWIGGSDTGVRAAEYGTIPQTGGLVYGINSDKKSYYVADYTGVDRYVYIPEKYLGYPVTAIGFEAFKNNNIVEYVDADYIITIEDSAFENANRLKEINLDSIESIGNYSFKNAISIERMKLPNSITKLGVSAFENTYEMKEFSFSDNTNIDILPDLLFKSSGIKELLVPTSVVIIGEQAFEQSKIASIVFENDSNLENIGKYAFREAVELIEIEIPEGVTVIKEGTFYRASKLEHLFLPESLLEIEKEAFSSSRINDLLIPKNVELIGELALSSLINLESLVIEDNSKLRELGKDVLYRTRNLKKIVIPNSVEKIGSGAFNEMWSLEYLSIPFVGQNRNGGKLAYFFGRTSYTNSYPVQTSSDSNVSFYLPISLKTVLINDSESISEDAFRATRYVENVYFSETILFVEKEIFALHSSAMIFTEHKGKPTGWKFSNGTIIFNGSWEFDQDGVPKLL